MTLTDANGCTSTESTDLFQASPPNLFVSGGGVLTCTAPRILTAEGSASLPPYTYFWSDGSTGQTLQTTVPGIFTVTVTDSKGCTKTSSGTVTAPPAIQIVQDIVLPVVCPGGSDGLVYVIISGGTGTFSALWSNGATTKNLDGIPAGNYTLTVTDTGNGCTQTFTVTVNVSFQPTISIVGNDTACLEKSAIYQIPNNNSNIEWQGNVTAGQGTNVATVLWTTPGAQNLAVFFDNAKGCRDTSTFSVFVETCVGTSEPGLAGVEVSPNPFSDFLKINFEKTPAENTLARLSDVQGRVVLEKVVGRETNNGSGGNTVQLETAGLPPGTYFLQIFEKEKTGVWKVVRM